MINVFKIFDTWLFHFGFAVANKISLPLVLQERIWLGCLCSSIMEETSEETAWMYSQGKKAVLWRCHSIKIMNLCCISVFVMRTSAGTIIKNQVPVRHWVWNIFWLWAGTDTGPRKKISETTWIIGEVIRYIVLSSSPSSLTKSINIVFEVGKYHSYPHRLCIE